VRDIGRIDGASPVREHPMTTAAPVRFTNTITIDRSPATVFAYLADLENLPRWNYAIDETRKITSGPVTVGSRYRQTRTVPVRSEEFLEVTEFERDRRLAIAGRLSAFPARITYVLEPAGSATTLTNTVALTPPRPLSLLAPLATRRISAAVAANLEALKHLLERD
jgi:uncharacterized protein YndB with AHSA1/START domain